MNQERIGKLIYEMRIERNLTQQELAEKIGVTDRAVSNWENGRRLPDYSILNSLCEVLNISIKELLNGEKVNIELQKINKEFAKDNKKIIALDDISYKFDMGVFYAITGHSGSGKSTLINILGLLEHITNGNYLLDGIDVSKLSDEQASFLRMKKFGFVFQNYYLDENLTALENVMLPLLINKNIRKENRESIAKNILIDFGLKDRLNHLPKELSGGEQQRVSIARSLVNDPDIILADEPTGNLDEENEKIIFEYLECLSKKGKMVIVVSHSNEIRKYADVVLTIKSGKLSE